MHPEHKTAGVVPCPYCMYNFANIKIKFCMAKSMNVNVAF